MDKQTIYQWIGPNTFKKTNLSTLQVGDGFIYEEDLPKDAIVLEDEQDN
jgi:hypothetical protein